MTSAAGAALPRIRPRPRVLRGGTFNCLHGRDPDRVAAWVAALVKRESLDFLCLQEATGYVSALRAAGLRVICPPGSHETVIVLAQGADGARARRVTMARTWVNTRGRVVPARSVCLVTVDGWLRVASVHFPPSVDWLRGHMSGPRARVACYRELARWCRRWLGRPEPRLLAGDFNEPADTYGRHSPRWFARRAGADIATDGGIDYVVSNGVSVTRMRRIPQSGGSDHHARVFVVTPPNSLWW